MPIQPGKGIPCRTLVSSDAACTAGYPDTRSPISKLQCPGSSSYVRASLNRFFEELAPIRMGELGVDVVAFEVRVVKHEARDLEHELRDAILRGRGLEIDR